jgi:hypothetical protein
VPDSQLHHLDLVDLGDPAGAVPVDRRRSWLTGYILRKVQAIVRKVQVIAHKVQAIAMKKRGTS